MKICVICGKEIAAIDVHQRYARSLLNVPYPPKEKIMSELAAGLAAELTRTVTKSDTAAQLGSGLVPVFGTPALVALMEAASVHALTGSLPEGQTTVGGQIELRHLAATPVGMTVRARAELIKVEGRKLTFQIEAWDEVEKIGEAAHQRYIIDVEKFTARAHAKKSHGK